MPRKPLGVADESLLTGRDFCIGAHLVCGALVNQGGVWVMSMGISKGMWRVVVICLWIVALGIFVGVFYG